MENKVKDLENAFFSSMFYKIFHVEDQIIHGGKEIE